jgi:hypothetical protein
MPADYDPSQLSYKPVAEVIGNLEITQLPPTYMPLEAVMMIKALDEEGEITWIRRRTKDLTAVEELGAIEAARVVMRVHIQENFIPDTEDDDDG